jgi:hypothetical protein
METDRSSAIPFALLCYGGYHETRLAMTSKFWISRLGALLMAFVLTVVPSASPAHAVEDARKVSVVSFGLFGDQGVFKSEATGAAQVVASRFGNGPITCSTIRREAEVQRSKHWPCHCKWQPRGWTPRAMFCF